MSSIVLKYLNNQPLQYDTYVMSGRSSEGGDDQPSLDELLPLNKAAERCGLSASHLRLLVREGEVWGTKIGRNWVTTEQAVREYLARDRRPGPKPDKKS